MVKSKAVALGSLVGVALALAPLSPAFADNRFHGHWGGGSHWGHGGQWGGGHGNGGYAFRGGHGYGGHGCYGCFWPLGLAAAVVGTAAAVVTAPFVAGLCGERALLRAAGLWPAVRQVRRCAACLLRRARGSRLLRAARTLLLQQSACGSGLLRSACSPGLLPGARGSRLLRSACALLRSAHGSVRASPPAIRTAAGLLRPSFDRSSRLFIRQPALIASLDEAIGPGRFDTASS
jgi:hypothetical protein